MNPPHAHRRYLPPAEPPRDSLARLLIGGAALVALFFVLFVLVPVMT